MELAATAGAGAPEGNAVAERGKGSILNPIFKNSNGMTGFAIAGSRKNINKGGPGE